MAQKDWKKVNVRKSKGKVTGTVVQNAKTGKTVTLLNPHGKYGKATVELQTGERRTNDGKVKTDKNGNVMHLTKEQKAYRAGYRSAIIDQTKAFKAGK